MKTFLLPKEFFLAEPYFQCSKEESQLIKHLFHTHNPFWKQGSALMFCSESSHLVGFQHKNYSYQNEPALFWGYWSIGEKQGKEKKKASQEDILFKSLFCWARKSGIHHILGPINFKTCFSYRLKLDHFCEPPFWGEPSNSSIYIENLEEMKFRCIKKYLTGAIDKLPVFRKLALRRLAPLVKRIKKTWHFKPLTKQLFENYKTDFLNLSNDLFSSNFAFQKIEPFDFSLLYNDKFSETICQKVSFALFDDESNLIGFCIALPHDKQTRCLLIKTIGITKKFPQSESAFVTALEYIFKSSENYESIAFCLVSEGNQIHKLIKKHYERKKTYGLFYKHVTF